MLSTKSAQPGTALVLGGSGAIGRAIAARLADQGWRLFLTHRTPSAPFDKFVADLRQQGTDVAPIHVDLTQVDVGEQLVHAIGEAALNGLVYAAGPKVRMTYVSRITPEEVRTQFESDTLAFYNAVHPLLQLLRGAEGTLVSITSAAVSRYAKQDMLSVAPKAAIEAMTRAIAAEEGPFGVRANCVGVGVIDSGLWDDLIAQGAYTDDYLAAAKRAIALRRFGTAADIAAAAAFLLSDEANWISGQTLNVDGGYAL